MLLWAVVSTALVPKVRVPARASSPAMQWYEGSAYRRPFISGNWALNPQTIGEAEDLLKLLAANRRAQESGGDVPAAAAGDAAIPDVAIFPPFCFLQTALDHVEGTTIAVGAQNIGDVPEGPGAHTGEVSAAMVRSLGCSMVLLGHADRRLHFNEDDQMIARKVRLALDNDLRAVLCVGETEEEYDADLRDEITALQLKKGLRLAATTEVDAGEVVIVYEPVWAISSGTVASPEEVQDAHVRIRRTLAQMYNKEVARRVLIQYGGPVKPETVDDFMRMPDIDGILAGPSSLNADQFARICEFSPPMDLPRWQPRTLRAREVVRCFNVAGESPVWSEREQRLYWVSGPEKELWSWTGRDAPEKWKFDTFVSSVALKRGGGVIVNLEDRVISFDPLTRESEYLATAPERGYPTRLSDARVDREGQLVVGMFNMYHREGATAGEDEGGLYQLSKQDGMREILDDRFRASNALCFSPDGETMYIADTPTRKLFAFDYDSEIGCNPESKRLIYTMPPALAGGPEGAITDEEGFVWLALSGASQVVRIDPETGDTDFVVMLPVKYPTSATIGGPNLDTLHITTRGPDGGGIFAVTLPMGIRGVPEPEADL